MEYKRYKSNIVKIFLIIFLNSFIFAYVIERLFALERGLSILEMQYITIIFSVISLFLEVPSGVLADKWKKKYVLALGLGFCFFEFFISIFAYSFSTFALAFIAAAIGCSLKSGTWDSILYQSLEMINKKQDYEKYRGYLKLIDYFTIGVVGIIGGYIAYKFNLVTNYWLSLISTPIAIVIALSLYEPKEEIKEKMKFQLFTHIGESLKIIRKERSLGNVILYGGIIGAILYGQLHEMTSLVYPEIGIPIYFFGYIGFAITLSGGFSAMLASKLKNRFSYNVIFGGILALSSCSIYMFSRSTKPWEVIYVIIAIFLMEMVQILTSGFIHNRVPDEYRATISSMESFALNGLTVLVGIIFGYFADKYSIFEGFTAMSVLLGGYGVIYIGQIIHSKVKEKKELKSSCERVIE